MKGALFDLDGTLVHSHLDFAAIRRETGFPEGIGLLEHLATLSDAQARSDALGIIHRHELAGAEKAEWMPGAQACLLKLVARNYPIGVVTRNGRATARLMIEKLEIPCDALVAREDAPAKPDPAGLLHISARWGVAPQQLFYLGDHRFDLEAARAAGMQACLYAPWGESPFLASADRVFNSFGHLEQWLGLA